MKKIIVFGVGLYAELAYFYLTYDSVFHVVGFTADDKYIEKDMLLGLPVVPFEDVQGNFSPAEHEMFLPLSYQRVNRFREERYYQAKEKGYKLATYISSKAVTWPELVIGDNCIVSENTTLGPRVRIGNDVAIGPNVVVGHHSVIGDHCFISSGAVILGGARVEPYCLLGANSTIKEGITIGSECVIGSGVFITNNTREKGVYVGTSAELLKKPSDELRAWFSWQSKPNGFMAKPDAGYHS